MANFDKYKCMRNIRDLLKDSDLRLGTIEKEAGCQAGYMSRLEKQDNNTDPSMEFVVTAAKMLNVPIDALLCSDLRGMTEDEQYLMKLLNTLIDDTKSYYLDWKLETEDFLSFGMEADPDTHKIKHPFFLRSEDDFENLYQTKIPGSGIVDIKGNSYHCKLLGSKMKIYFMSVVECNVPHPKSFYELYLVENDEEPYVINPICSSKEIHEFLRVKIKMLYFYVEKNASHIHINQDLKNKLNVYMEADYLR